MRIAIIADIHANLFALDAVLEVIDGETFDEILVGGDMVGRGPQGSAVCRLVRERGWRSVRGNHEDYLIAFRRKTVDPKWLVIDEWGAARWMSAELSTDDLHYIESLPFDLRSSIDPRVSLFHGSPKSNSEGLGSWTPEETLRGHLDSVTCDLMAVAHTHRPISWTIDGRLLANVGSVGMPFTGDPRAQFTVFEKGDDGWRADVRLVEYDIDAAVAMFASSGFLAAGGVTAMLLTYEIRIARPHLVPFLRWVKFHSYGLTMENAERFLEWFDPAISLKDLISTLKSTP